MKEKASFINNFHSLRLICSVLVVYSHAYALLGLDEPTLFLRTAGNFSVHCFFILSGYLITTSYSRAKNILDFLYKRILRILPAFIVAYYLAHFVSAQCNNFIGNPVPYISNGPVWTLTWEVVAYLFCAIIGFVGLLTPSGVGALWLASWVAIISNFSNTSATYQVIVPMLFMFLSGGFIAVNEEKFNLRYTGPVAMLFLVMMNIGKVGIVGVVLDKIPFLYGPQMPYAILYYFLYALLLPIAIIYIGKYFPITISLKNDISYGVYIYAWPIQQSIVYLALKNNFAMTPLSFLVITLVCTYILSYVSWIGLEKPVLALKNVNGSEIGKSLLNKILR